jgi:lipoate-protein ligase A
VERDRDLIQQDCWRLIPPMSAAGAVHMAVDMWLLEQQQQGHLPPTLRFYTWEPAAISLGYHQQHWPARWAQMTWRGTPLDLVLRPSGGRAVLHQGDLTYAIVLPITGQRRQDCYRRICDALVAAWKTLGLTLHYGTAGRGYIHHPSCFGTATAADLVTETGYKLIGSAQLRRGQTVLQQGSMRFAPDPVLHQQVFQEPLECRPEILMKANGDQWHSAIVQAVTQAIAAQFHITFDPIPLSPGEHQAALREYGDRAIPSPPLPKQPVSAPGETPPHL